MKLACVFPGQGSQSVGMVDGFSGHPVVRQTFAEASAALGQDLWALAAAGPDAELALTVNTQPVMLTAGVAAYRALLAEGAPKPVVMAGHSLGEYTALVCAGALDLAEAVPLIRFRAQAMQEAVPSGVGAMAAILGLEDAAVGEACAAAAQGQVVEPVNFNAPSQVVIAGHREAVERAMQEARARGAKRSVLLPVSAPFHCSLLKPAAARLAERLAGVPLRAPEITVIHNADVATAESADAIRAALSRQAASPVRWVETVREFASRGVTHVAECGPGKVLAGLNRRIAPEMEAFAVVDSAAVQAAVAAMRGTGDA
jgi:[acyl-carrier-protein] S-malonyltransferase